MTEYKDNDFIDSIERLLMYCENNEYKGYSLYDSHNSPIPFKKLGRRLSFIINQVIKRSPINFRPIIGVKKGINPKGYGLFLHAYSLLADSDFFDKKIAKDKARFFFNWLVENPSKGYNGHSWGYNYYWPKRNGDDTPAYTPSVVVTGFVARAMLEYYNQLKNNKVKEILKSCASFVINDIPLYKGSDGYCFSYTPIKKDLVVNANLLAAEILTYSDYVNKKNKYSTYIEEVIKYTINKQNKDGSWYYAFDYNSGMPKKQIDFHQGYVIESLYNIDKYSKVNKQALKQSIEKGVRFYYKNQFSKEGWAFWRLPKKWPVDIHNQSQGIITFSKFASFNDEYLPFAETIAKWTINNMQSSMGNFYYQKWPLVTNKVSYMRWNQGWILVALSSLLASQNKNRGL